MHVRLNLVTADPAKLYDVVDYVRHDVRAMLEGRPGNMGMSLLVNDPLGIAIVESYWFSGDAMRESEHSVAASRAQAVRRGAATVSVERFVVASSTRTRRPEAGAGVRLTRVEGDAKAVDRIATAYEDIALPWLTDTDGFCGATLYEDRATGRGIRQTYWRDPVALSASRGAAAGVRAEVVAAADGSIRALEEYSLVFTSGWPE
ncbi:MAG: hypothetical protein JWN35_1225 [Frankiales bacterium]|nr:hypothetical protein [Frankiales bacterium]